MSRQDLDSPEEKKDAVGKNTSKNSEKGIGQSTGRAPYPSEVGPFSSGESDARSYITQKPEDSVLQGGHLLPGDEQEDFSGAAINPENLASAGSNKERSVSDESDKPARTDGPTVTDETGGPDAAREIPKEIPLPSNDGEASGQQRDDEAVPSNEIVGRDKTENTPRETAPPTLNEATQEPVLPDEAVPPPVTGESEMGNEATGELSASSEPQLQNTAEKNEGTGDSTPASSEGAGQAAADTNPTGLAEITSAGAVGFSSQQVPSVEIHSAEEPSDEVQSGRDEEQEISSATEQPQFDDEPAGRLPAWDEVPAAKNESGVHEEDEAPREDDSTFPPNEEERVIEGEQYSASSDESVSTPDDAEVPEEVVEPTPVSKPAGSPLNGLEGIIEGGGEELEARDDVADDLAHIIESIIFASDEPLSVATIKSVLDAAHTFGRVNPDMITSRINALNAKYEADGSGFYIVEIANGFQYATRKEHAQWVSNLFKERSKRKLSNSALESVAIIAYKQPITKPEIESIRGVNVDYVLHNLLEKELITVVGRAETVGRPLLYGTTQKFLKVFALKRLDDLPKLREIEEIIKEIKSKGAEESIQLEITALGDSSMPEQTTEHETKPEVTSENGTE